MSLIVSSQISGNSATVEDMHEVLGVLLAERAGISGLLPPQVEICIVR